MKNVSKRGSEDLGIDAEVGNRLIQVRIGVAALRSIRLGLMQLAYALSERRDSTGFLALVDTTVTRKRLQREWQQAAAVLRPELSERITLCILNGGTFICIPRDPDQKTQRIILESIEKTRPRRGPRLARADASFFILKILILHWLTDGRPTTVQWLAHSSGYSYPTVASVLRGLGSLIERRSDRRIRLRWFPKEEFARLLAVSPRARTTVRYADRSGQARTIEAHLHRLEKLNPRGLAIGGIMGARSYVPDIDLVGVPRLDLSLHSPRQNLDLDFIGKLDPALKRIHDPLEPATVVVHFIRQVDPFFSPREGGLSWADQLECLFDLHEAGLQKQASQFLNALLRNRSLSP
jgi:hypothetical protein